MKIILHIGAGKTGTSSIQKMLFDNQKELKRQGYYYLGFMLENAYKKKYTWQKRTPANDDFFSLPMQQAFEEMYEILNDTIKKAEQDDIHTLIWSNESFFGNRKPLMEVLKKLKEKNIELRVVAYIRRHDSWAQSAYLQWGIKHKTYTGKLQSFSEWIKENLPNFSARLKGYATNFSKDLYLRNMDAIENKDVVIDFLKFIGIDYGKIMTVRHYGSAENEEILFRALFNSHYDDKVLPIRFNRAFEFENIEENAESYLAKLLPSSSDLKAVQELTRQDRERVNAYFKENNQAEIETIQLPEKTINVDRDKLIMIMARAIAGQAKKIEKLEERIKLPEKKS